LRIFCLVAQVPVLVPFSVGAPARISSRRSFC